MEKELIKVLYIDDEKPALFNFEHLFQDDFEVFTAPSAALGMEILANNEIPIVISDQRMPQKSGIEFLTEVAQFYPDTVRILLTAYSEAEVIIDAINQGQIYQYITKPFDSKNLKNILDKASQNWLLHKENKLLIKELKTKNEVLAESERRFRELLSTVEMISIILDLEANIVYCNEYFLKLTGWKKEEIIGKNWFKKFITPELSDTISTIFNEAVKNNNIVVNYENTIIKKSGSEVLVSWNNTVLYDENGNIISIASLGVDITEQKRAELALKKNQKLLAETESLGNTGGWELDIKSQKLTWTAQTYLIHELHAESEPTLETAINFYTPESIPIISEAVNRAIEFGEAFDLELEIITSKSNRRNVHAIGKFDEKLNRVYGYFQDITSRKKAELALIESEEKYRLFTDNSGLGVGIYSPDGKVILYNQQALKNMGGVAEDFVGKSVFEIFDKKSATIYFNRIQQSIKQDNSMEYEDFVQLPNADYWFLSNYKSIKNNNGEIIAVQIISKDISERRRVEIALKDSERKLRKLLTDSSFLIDSNTEDANYQKITDIVVELSGANYVSFDVVNNTEKYIQTYAISGIKENVMKICSMLGYQIANKKWNWDPVRAEDIKPQIITRFESLNHITASQMPKAISKLIEITFNLGEVVIVKIAQKNETIGFFSLFFSKGDTLQNSQLIELYANQVGLFLERKKADEALIKKNEDLDYMNKFMVNREVRMAEMKKEVNELLERLGEENRYL